MDDSIATAITELSKEVSAINRTLLAIWSLISPSPHGQLPLAVDTEYITIEECARRLEISEQTIRNWIVKGKKDPDGWVQGVHYITIPDSKGKGRTLRRQTVRIPWNTLIQYLIVKNQDRKASLKDIQQVLAPKDPLPSKDQYF